MALRVAVLIPAAGSSRRFKGKKKKPFTDMDGRAVFLRTLEAFSDRADVKQTIMAIPQDDEEIFKIKWGASVGFFGTRVILGGSERWETVEKLMAAITEEVDLIALHDAVRPCVTQTMIDAVFAAAAQSGAAILAHRLVGTIKQGNDQAQIVKTIDRRELWEAQTPQVFKPDILKKAYANRANVKGEITDDAQLVEALGLPVQLVESDTSNIKITHGTDIAIAEAIIRSRPKPKPSGPVGPWAAEQMW